MKKVPYEIINVNTDFRADWSYICLIRTTDGLLFYVNLHHTEPHSTCTKILLISLTPINRHLAYSLGLKLGLQPGDGLLLIYSICDVKWFLIASVSPDTYAWGDIIVGPKPFTL